MTPDVPPEIAAEVVATDPFWSVVRRRHADLDIVVLPGGAPQRAEWPEEAPVVDDLDSFAEDSLRWSRGFWDAVGSPEPAMLEDGWRLGARRDALRHEVTLRARLDDPVAGVRLIVDAAELLREGGWNVLEPDAGQPRLLAGREGVIDRWELILLHFGSTLVLRVKSGSVRVTRDRAHAEVVGA